MITLALVPSQNTREHTGYLLCNHGAENQNYTGKIDEFIAKEMPMSLADIFQPF